MDSKILDEKSVSFKKERKLIVLLRWLLKNWNAWLPILASVVALWVSINSNEVSQKLAKLDFRPIVRLDTLFKSAGKIPPHFSITNTGPVDALQIKIRMFSYRFSSNLKQMSFSGNNSANDILIPKLRPQETKAFKFSQSWLRINARLGQPAECTVMEIRVSYRRPQDLTEYDESAFYFVNPDGLWVSEQSSSLNTEHYGKIKKAIFKVTAQKEFSIYREWAGDKLHSND